MGEFLSTYGLWILLTGIFFAMHAFGMGCCGGHRHAGAGTKRAGTKATGEESDGGKANQPARERAGGCH